MRPYWHNLFQRLQGDQGEGLPPGPAVPARRCPEAPASRLYGLGAGLRRSLYARGLTPDAKTPGPGGECRQPDGRRHRQDPGGGLSGPVVAGPG